ncbi:MAG TPA: hypothetical protein VIU61_21595 [Kofleriaceae bacterium]
MKKITNDKKLRLATETLQVLSREEIDGARGGFAQTTFTTGGGGTGGVSVNVGCSASCGMGCDLPS